MLDLRQKSITLVGVDCKHIEQLIVVADHCESLCRFTAVKLLTDKSLDDARIVRIPSITSIHDYSAFVFKQLASYIETDYALLVQYDGYIQDPDAWTDEFLAYDYIGAPWAYPEQNVGNGGFTLRSKRLLTVLQNDATLTKTAPEDERICRTYRSYLEAQGMRFAPEELAARFSIEGNSKHGFAWHGQFGFHDFSSTLGVAIPHETTAFRLTDALRHIIDKRLKEALGDARITVRMNVADDTITAAGDLMFTFLMFYVMHPLMKMSKDRGLCAYEIEIRDHAAYPDSLWLVVRAANAEAQAAPSEWRGWHTVFSGEDIIFEREIPRTQRTFAHPRANAAAGRTRAKKSET